MEKQILLGSECDDKLLENIRQALKHLDAKLIKEQFCVVGLQDIDIYYFYIGNMELIFEIEAYIGINIRGEEAVVDLFQKTLNEI